MVIPSAQSAPDPVPTAEEPQPASPERSASGGLVSAAARLDARTSEQWSAVLHSMHASLAEGEAVGALVCGRVHGSLAAVTRTDRRILLVVERAGRMAVESLHPLATGVMLRPGPAGTLVIVLVDRGRQLEFTDVSDVSEAESLTIRDALSAGDVGGQAGTSSIATIRRG